MGGLLYEALCPNGVFLLTALFSPLLYASNHFSCQVQWPRCFRDTRLVQKAMSQHIDSGLTRMLHFCDIRLFGVLQCIPWFSEEVVRNSTVIGFKFKCKPQQKY